MNTIVFKSYYLTKNLYWIFGIGILFSTAIFLFSDIAISSSYQIITAILGCACLILVYMNRLEPHYIKFDDDKFSIDYLNKFIFKTDTKIFSRKEIKALLETDILILSDDQGKKAILRQKALDKNDWEVLKQYFS